MAAWSASSRACRKLLSSSSKRRSVSSTDPLTTEVLCAPNPESDLRSCEVVIIHPDLSAGTQGCPSPLPNDSPEGSKLARCHVCFGARKPKTGIPGPSHPGKDPLQKYPAGVSMALVISPMFVKKQKQNLRPRNSGGCCFCPGKVPPPKGCPLPPNKQKLKARRWFGVVRSDRPH